MSMLFYPLVFIFGLVAGSFLNCIIYRLETKQSFLKGRSFCPHCKHILRWYDLMPVLSFIILQRKCRYCEKKISFQYPIVEISTALIFLLISNFQFSPKESLCDPTGQAIFNEFSIFNFQTIITAVYFLVISSFLIIIFVYDLKHYIIPDKVIYPAIAVVFVFRLFENLSIENWSLIENWKLIIENFAGPLLAAIAASLFFFLIWAVSKGQWLGFGDVKLAFLIGLFLGWPSILVGLFAGFFIGAIIGTGLMLLGKKKLKSQVPFGPFLVTGTFIALFWGQEIVRWYLSLI